MTYGWGLILIATTVGVLVFVIGSPAEQFRCTISDPQKFILKAYTVPGTAEYITGVWEIDKHFLWLTDASTSKHNTIILQNITGGKITILRVEAFVEDLYTDNGPCSHMPPDIWAGDLFTWQGMQDQCFGNAGYGSWCVPYTIEDEYWIDISCAKTSYIHNFMNKMSLNGVWLAHDYVVGAPPEDETMCNGGVTVEVGAGGLIELKDFQVQTLNCTVPYEGAGGNEPPARLRVVYTDQFGLHDDVEITCMGYGKKPPV